MEFRNAVYSSADGLQIDMEINHPSFGWIPFTARDDDPEQLGRDLYAAALLDEIGGYVEPDAPPPIEAEPVRIACALRVPIVDGEVQQIGGAFRVAAMILMDTGTFLAIFSQGLGAEPYVIPNNGISVEITEWAGDYAMLEVRDHAGGSLITPSSFGFSLYQI